MARTTIPDEITGTEDILDTRDIDERIKWLEDTSDKDDPDYDDEQEELAALVAFRDEAQPYCLDWQYGEALISEGHFQEYAGELADDLGLYSRDQSMQWPLNHIDWQAAADELKYDYTAVELMGTTYYVR